MRPRISEEKKSFACCEVFDIGHREAGDPLGQSVEHDRCGT